MEELAARARKAESAGFRLSQPNSPQPPSARSSSGRLPPTSELPAPPHSANLRRSGSRSPFPPASVNAEHYVENGAPNRAFRGNGAMKFDPEHPNNGGQGDPFSDQESVFTMDSQSTNTIPISYIPPSESTGTVNKAVLPNQAASAIQAARTLDEARQNLFRPRQTPPQRPIRSSDLHLRLSPPKGRESAQELRSPDGEVRDSYLSASSSAPSFLSGNSYDIHADAPRIFTSKQVQVGRLQQAEVVQFGQKEAVGSQRMLSPIASMGDNDFDRANYRRLPPAGINPISQLGATSSRTLTPMNRNLQQEDAEEGLVSEEPIVAGATDLRFSMGSLAYDRNSVSTMGTGNFLARSDAAVSASPRPQQYQYEARESMLSTFSGKSNTSSFFNTFPMIPPPQAGHTSYLHSSGLPQSTSVSTLDQAATVARPPTAFKNLTSIRPSTSGSINTARPGTAPSRPTTAVSYLETSKDSFLGGFPFIPPNTQGEAELPSARLPDTAVSKGVHAGRNTQGMSMTSEGLGGFDFSFEGAPPLPRGVGEKR